MRNKSKTIPPISESDKDRFWQKVSKTSPDSCWEWTGVTACGYGKFSLRGSLFQSSRVAFTISNGPLLEGMDACHKCDNRKCCNPAHIYAGSHSDNMQDKVNRGRCNLPVGDAHYSRTSPERLARGCRNGANTRPDVLPRGVAHGMAKLDDNSVREIRRFGQQGMRQRDIARAFGVTQPTVGRIIRRAGWKHIKDN